MITVGLADDQALVRDGFRLILEVEEGFEVVGEAANGNEAIDMAKQRTPDVLLMDIRMPLMDGISATREIAKARLSTKVLILTTFDHDEYLYEAVKAGAAGFLVKDATREQLVGAIRTVADGDALLAPALLRRLLDTFTAGPPPAQGPPGALGELSERELDVLRQMARGSTNAEIGEALYVSETTAKTHVSHILQKLQLRDRVEAVVLAYETGFVRPGRD